MDILQQQYLQGLVVQLRNESGTLIDEKTLGDANPFNQPLLANFDQPPGVYQISVLHSNDWAGAFSASNSNDVPSNPSSDYGNPRNLSAIEFGTVSYDGSSFSDTTSIEPCSPFSGNI